MKKAAWLLPSFLEGSGGHRTIFQNIQVLADNGFEVDVYVEKNGTIFSDDELKRQVKKFFGEYDCTLILGFNNIKSEYDVIFATAWFTAKIVRDIPGKAKKVYFVQDFEALFNPMGDGYLMAVNSYRYGLSPITIGRWLSNKMEKEFHAHSHFFDFCADTSIYHELQNSKKENAICFVYQPEKPRRCNRIGIEALGILKALRPDVKIYLYGSKEKGDVWFEHENLGIISLEKCNALYNKCAVGLCLSSSNPSRIPFEMMAAGLPVVDLYLDNNLYDMPSDSILLAQPTPESIATALLRLIDNEDLRTAMSSAGIDYMKDRALKKGYSQFSEAVMSILSDEEQKKQEIEKIYTKDEVIADVFLQSIPKQNNLIFPKNKKNVIQKLKSIKFFQNSRLAHKVWRGLKKIKRGGK